MMSVTQKIETDAKVEAMQNILIDVDGSLYAKILSNDGGKITVCFTSKPECFTKWAETLR